jgi:HK97 gp10 family phage protein
MPLDAKLTLTGGPQLEKALKDLGSAVAGRLGENAVRAGARQLATIARRNASWVDRTGTTRKSIKAFSDPNSRRSGGSQRIAYAGSRYFVARFFELGTSKMPAKPFLRPALDVGGQQAVDKLIENLGRGIDREVAKRGAEPLERLDGDAA